MSGYSWDSMPSQKAEMIRKPAYEEGYRKGREDGIDEMLKEVKHRAKMFSDGKRIYVGEEVLLQTFDLGTERLEEQGG